MNVKNAVIITGNKYPDGDPGAVRQHSMAKIFESLGYDVFVIGYGNTSRNIVNTYENIKYTSMRTAASNQIVRLAARICFGYRVIRYMKKNKMFPSVLLVVDVLPDAFYYIEKYAKKHNCILIHDSVEWYSPEEFKRGKKDIEYQLKEYTNTKAIHNPWKVIAISNYLNQYFLSRKLESVRIPVIMNVEKMSYSLEANEEKTVFVYAGGPGRKDYLKEILEGYALLEKDVLAHTEFHVIGVDKKGLQNACAITTDILDYLGESLIIHGRLARQDTIQWVKKADFTVLLRNSELRYAKAGFPTKVVESLANGTPVICNYSSDLELYLKDNDNAVIVRSYAVGDVKVALERAIAMSKSKRETMRSLARKTAERNFDYRKYTDIIAELIKY